MPGWRVPRPNGAAPLFCPWEPRTLQGSTIMGAQPFRHSVKRGTFRGLDGSPSAIDSPHTAFRAAVWEAERQHGRGGYSGTIAEKLSFILVTASGDRNARRYIAVGTRPGDLDGDAVNAGDDVTLLADDKWGPALCIADADGWTFFGWAST